MDFSAEVEPYRKELLAHCYRMTGSLSDAEDALQDTLVRVWRGLDAFEGRASLRTWLYRVTTNTCLNFVSARRARTLPYTERPAGHPDDKVDAEPHWLEPFPDTLLDDGPDATYSRREAVRLAFVVALQALPARQRAVLLLREVVALSAEETAEALELTVPACNSLLQRARTALEDQPRVRATPIAADIVEKYMRAWEAADANALIAILRADVISSMPPNPLWLRGPADFIAYMQTYVWAGGPVKLVPFATNASPAFAVYQRDQLVSLNVLELDGDRIAAMHHFLGYKLP
jgi:RNA polymerase sigma-70 factor (ECF subfamily)